MPAAIRVVENGGRRVALELYRLGQRQPGPLAGRQATVPDHAGTDFEQALALQVDHQPFAAAFLEGPSPIAGRTPNRRDRATGCADRQALPARDQFGGNLSGAKPVGDPRRQVGRAARRAIGQHHDQRRIGGARQPAQLLASGAGLGFVAIQHQHHQLQRFLRGIALQQDRRVGDVARGMEPRVAGTVERVEQRTAQVALGGHQQDAGIHACGLMSASGHRAGAAGAACRLRC